MHVTGPDQKRARLSRIQAAGLVRLRSVLPADDLRLRRSADRRVDVSLSQGGMVAQRPRARRADFDRFRHHRTRHPAVVAARRRLEPREGCRGDGDGLEPGDNRLRLCRIVQRLARYARLHRPRRSRLWPCRGRDPVERVSDAHARHHHRRISRGRVVRFGAGCRARRRHLPRIGAGRPLSAWSASPVLCSPCSIMFVRDYQAPELPSTRRRTAQGARHRPRNCFARARASPPISPAPCS